LSRRSRPQAIWLSERPSICCSPTSTASGAAWVAPGSSSVLRTASPGHCRSLQVANALSDVRTEPNLALRTLRVKHPGVPLPNRDRSSTPSGDSSSGALAQNPRCQMMSSTILRDRQPCGVRTRSWW
jgi:hypothetical protein